MVVVFNVVKRSEGQIFHTKIDGQKTFCIAGLGKLCNNVVIFCL
jgi:hypothetical protein